MPESAQQHTTFESFLNEKYKGGIIGHLKNALGKRVPEMDKYAKLIGAALEELANKPTAFEVFAVEMHPNNVVDPKQLEFTRYKDAKKTTLKDLYKLIDEIDDMIDTINDVKVLTGVRTSVRSTLETLKQRLHIESKDAVNFVVVVDDKLKQGNYYAHYGMVGPDSTLATGQANVVITLQNLKRIFDGDI